MRRLWLLMGRVAFIATWPALFVYLRGTHRTRVLIHNGDSILLVQSWLGMQRWGLPGGGLHRGEDEQLGAAREVLEETGVVIDKMQALGTEPYRSYGISFHAHYFESTIVAVQPLVLQRFEIMACEWFAINQLPEKVSAEVKRALELAAKS